MIRFSIEWPDEYNSSIKTASIEVSVESHAADMLRAFVSFCLVCGYAQSSINNAIADYHYMNEEEAERAKMFDREEGD